MTFTMKVRGAPSGRVLHDYTCPEHGRFEAEVDRSEVPDAVSCPKRYPPRMIALFGANAEEAERIRALHVCGKLSPWAPSPISGRVKLGEVVKGKVMDYPPEHVVMDTRPLADGMPMHEFRAKQMAITRDLNLKKARANRR
jgi:hypothetical protein